MCVLLSILELTHLTHVQKMVIIMITPKNYFNIFFFFCFKFQTWLYFLSEVTLVLLRLDLRPKSQSSVSETSEFNQVYHFSSGCVTQKKRHILNKKPHSRLHKSNTSVYWFTIKWSPYGTVKQKRHQGWRRFYVNTFKHCSSQLNNKKNL